jgi:hypothetical protein
MQSILIRCYHPCQEDVTRRGDALKEILKMCGLVVKAGSILEKI